MPTKEDISTRIKTELTTRDLSSFKHKELIQMKVDLIANIPGSGGVWYQEAMMLCGLIDNKLTLDKLSQSWWQRYGYPLLLEVLKLGIVSAITFTAGYIVSSYRHPTLSTSHSEILITPHPNTHTSQSVPNSHLRPGDFSAHLG